MVTDVTISPMAKSDPQLTDQQAAIVQRELIRLHRTAGSDANVARLLSDDAHIVATSNVNRWRRVRPSMEAAERLSAARILDLESLLSGDYRTTSGGPMRVSPSAVAELRLIARKLAELADRIERASGG